MKQQNLQIHTRDSYWKLHTFKQREFTNDKMGMLLFKPKRFLRRSELGTRTRDQMVHNKAPVLVNVMEYLGLEINVNDLVEKYYSLHQVLCPCLKHECFFWGASYHQIHFAALLLPFT